MPAENADGNTKLENMKKEILAESGDHWRGIVPAGFFAIAGVIMLIVMTYQPVGDAREVGMMFPFSMSEDEILTRVGANGGRVVRFGGLGNIAVVIRDDGTAPEAVDFGALFSLNPIVLSVCALADDDLNIF